MLGTALAYAVVQLLTRPTFVGDTPDYALSAVARALGGYCNYLEPGHLLWRPTGHVMLVATGAVQPGVATDALVQTSQLQLGWAAMAAGLATILLCAAWLLRRTESVAATAFGVAVVLLSKAFVNFSQVGVSYIPALAFLFGALYLLSPPNDNQTAGRSFAAGVLLGLSVLMWGTFAVAIPAALAGAILFAADTRLGVRHAMLATAGGLLVAIGAAAWVSLSLGFSSVDQLRAWAGDADHGISVGGIPRAVLGFARSYLETGDYGRLVKRFLLKDPSDPVSASELIGFPLVGIAVFYAGILLSAVLAWRHPGGRSALAFFVLNAIPVGLFAIAWQGGDLERYLPLVPGVALLLATAFAASSLVPRLLLAGWLAVIIVPNARTLATPAVMAEEARLRSTLTEVEVPGRRRLLVFSHWQDERVQYDRNRAPSRDLLPVRFYALVSPGNPEVPRWRTDAAERILNAWDAGTEVFVSERLLANEPRREWQWVEGDDERISWRDFNEFFSPFEFGTRVGTVGDGFLPLPPSPANRRAIEAHRDPGGPPAVLPGCALPERVRAAGVRRALPGADAAIARATRHGYAASPGVTTALVR